MTRIPDFDTHPGSAAGLGLAIVAAIVSAHGGRLDATSEPGHTEFTIELPPVGTTELPTLDTVSAPSVPSVPPVRSIPV